MNKNLPKKIFLFEYFVFKLLEWKESLPNADTVDFTKIQLHKLLFLASATTAKVEDLQMFNYFKIFYALQYGPVEIDIYRAMCNNGFNILTFESRYCRIKSLNNYAFGGLTAIEKNIVDDAIAALRKYSNNYVLYNPFKLVTITHEWTVWKVSYAFAEVMGNKMEHMDIKEIIDSKKKVF